MILRYLILQEEVKEVTSLLSVCSHNIKVTEVLKDGDTLTFLIVSQKVRMLFIYLYVYLMARIKLLR